MFLAFALERNSSLGAVGCRIRIGGVRKSDGRESRSVGEVPPSFELDSDRRRQLASECLGLRSPEQSTAMHTRSARAAAPALQRPTRRPGR